MELRHKLVQCPFDHQHFVKAGRLQQHIVKCKKNHLSEEFKMCPFNACHRVHPAEERLHIANCPDRVVLERQLYYASQAVDGVTQSGDLTLPEFTTEPVPCDNSELWEEDKERMNDSDVADDHNIIDSDDATPLLTSPPSIVVTRRRRHRLNRDESVHNTAPKTLPKALAHLCPKMTPKTHRSDSNETSGTKAPHPNLVMHDTLNEVEMLDMNPRSVQEILADVNQAVDDCPDYMIDDTEESSDGSDDSDDFEPRTAVTDGGADTDAVASQPRGLGRGMLRDGNALASFKLSEFSARGTRLAEVGHGRVPSTAGGEAAGVGRGRLLQLLTGALQSSAAGAQSQRPGVPAHRAVTSSATSSTTQTDATHVVEDPWRQTPFVMLSSVRGRGVLAPRFSRGNPASQLNTDVTSL